MNKKNRILIVDDIEDNLSVLGNLLMRKQYAVQLATSGELAIEITKRKLPDLILLDVSMPGLSGYEVCKTLKKNELTKDIPIIFLTAHSETEDIVEGFKLGAVDYITKPFNEAELLSRVRTHLELKHSKEKLTQKTKQLEQLNATKDKLFSIISHDLRSPFSAIIGYSEIAKRDCAENNYSEIESHCIQISKSAKRSYDLVNNLLNWARVQTGKINFSPQIINVQDVAESVIENLELSSKEKNIEVAAVIEPGLKVKADTFMFESILLNLTSNAIKFTKSGGQIKIIGFDAKGFVEISVEDNGVGIQQEKIDSLFSIETNNTTTGTNNEKGSGLGLVLCKEFVDYHKGKIWAESKVEKGSKFTFTISRA